MQFWRNHSARPFPERWAAVRIDAPQISWGGTRPGAREALCTSGGDGKVEQLVEVTLAVPSL